MQKHLRLPLRNWRMRIQDKNISDVLGILGAPQRKLLMSNMDMFLKKVTSLGTDLCS